MDLLQVFCRTNLQNQTLSRYKHELTDICIVLQELRRNDRETLGTRPGPAWEQELQTMSVQTLLLFEGVTRLTLDCLCFELPHSVTRMTGLESLRVMFYDQPMYTDLIYPALTGLQRLTELSITCEPETTDEEPGSFPPDLGKLSTLESFEASIPTSLCRTLNPGGDLQLQLTTQLTKLVLQDLFPYGGITQNDEVSLRFSSACTCVLLQSHRHFLVSSGVQLCSSHFSEYSMLSAGGVGTFVAATDPSASPCYSVL